MLHIHDRTVIVTRARKYLSAVPPAISGSGGHDATFRAACVPLHGFNLSVDESRPVLREWNASCRPPWSEAELEHKLASAAATSSDRPPGYLLKERERVCLPPTQCYPVSAVQAKPKWPTPDLARIAEIVEAGPGAAALSLFSPGPLDVEDAGYNCGSIVQAMFADDGTPDPLLCIGKSSREFATRPLSAWIACERLANFSLIVPAHMTARAGRTKAGKLSEHTLQNTGQRCFVVVEFDFVEINKATGEPTRFAPLIARWREAGKSVADACAALLWHLDGYAPLALVVHSGGKSLHGHFPTADFQSNEIRRFMEYAALLGADTKLFSNPSQFVRLAGGTREGGCRQSVFYYAPDALKSLVGNTGESNAHE